MFKFNRYTTEKSTVYVQCDAWLQIQQNGTHDWNSCKTLNNPYHQEAHQPQKISSPLVLISTILLCCTLYEPHKNMKPSCVPSYKVSNALYHKFSTIMKENSCIKWVMQLSDRYLSRNTKLMCHCGSCSAWSSNHSYHREESMPVHEGGYHRSLVYMQAVKLNDKRIYRNDTEKPFGVETCGWLEANGGGITRAERVELSRGYIIDHRQDSCTNQRVPHRVGQHSTYINVSLHAA